MSKIEIFLSFSQINLTIEERKDIFKKRYHSISVLHHSCHHKTRFLFEENFSRKEEEINTHLFYQEK